MYLLVVVVIDLRGRDNGSVLRSRGLTCDGRDLRLFLLHLFVGGREDVLLLASARGTM